ncbi:MAG: TonB-dependent receptor [Pseudomonadales bacterium]|nr:TonB-dependent receptor [Pseudomonadales bacterium]
MQARSPTIRFHSGSAPVLCTVLLSTLALPSLHAQQSALSEDTIVVSAHRIPTVAGESGSRLSVTDRALIEQRQSVHASDLLQNIPGVAVNRTAGAGSQTQVRVRGAEANQVLVLIDGVEANDPAGNDEFDFSALTAYDIEHIELVRGPQSALWGSDAGAGVIHIRTRTADAPLSGGGFIEGGSLDTLYSGGRIAATGERGALAIAASYYDSRGESAADAGTEKDGYENLTLALNAHLEPSEGLRFGFSARYRDSTSQYDDVDFSTGLPADADRESHDNLLLLNSNAALTLMDGRWDQALKLTYLDSQRRQFADDVQQTRTSADKFGAYYQSTLNLGESRNPDRQRLVLALDHERENFEQRADATLFGNPNQDQEMHNTGLVAEYLIDPLENLHLGASIRRDDNSDFDDITTYRLTSSYLFDTSATRLHASWGTGQKSPTFIERFGYFSDQFLGNPGLKPEKTEGFDIGIEQSLLEGRLSVDVTYFNEELKDEIDGFVFDPDTFLFTADNLSGTSHREGAEVEITAFFGAATTARLSYTYTDALQPDASGGGSSREIRRPRHMASLNLNQGFLDTRGNLNLNLVYSGTQTDQFFPPPVFAAQTIELDDYVLVDIAASYALNERITIYARGTNMFDEKYTNVIGFNTPGRGIYAGVRVGLAR